MRLDNGNGIVRYTYAATTDFTRHTIIVFKDFIDGLGKVSSSSKSNHLRTSAPICYIGCSHNMIINDSANAAAIQGSIFVVCANGDAFSFDPESLEQRWKESTSRLSRDVLSNLATDYTVEFMSVASTKNVVRGLFGGRMDAINMAFPQHLDLENEDPDALLLITSMMRNGIRERQFSVLGVLPAQDISASALQWMVRLHTAKIPALSEADESSWPHFQLFLRSGSLLELCSEKITIYDLTVGIPRVRHELHTPNATSFLRLSGRSILACSSTALDIYNAAFHSLQTSIPLDVTGASTEHGTGNGNVAEAPGPEYRLLTYFAHLDLAVGLLDNKLVGVQVEPPRASGKRSYGDGLLIDSIGRGTTALPAQDFVATKRRALEGDAREVQSEIAEMERADDFLRQGDLRRFEDFLSKKFGVSLRESAMMANGTSSGTISGTRGATDTDDENLPEWKWLDGEHYPKVEGNWVQYAISRVLAIDWVAADDADKMVSLALSSSNVVIYLVVGGHLMLGEVRAACGSALQNPEAPDHVLAEGLIRRLVDIDPAMHLLLNYTSATYLGAIELVLIIRTLMQSLGYIGSDPSQNEPNLLTGEESTGTNDDSEVLTELEELERQLQATEQQILDDDDARPRALMAALAKLAGQPAQSVVKGLRSLLKVEDIASLIHVLRAELARGGWTSRYALSSLALDVEAPPPDESIAILASLLSRCVDAIGLSGWLMNDSVTRGHHPEADLLSKLVLEVSAALEGLEEVVSLKHFLEPFLKYAEDKVEEARRSKTAMGTIRNREAKGCVISVAAPQVSLLPMDLRPRPPISDTKVEIGGLLKERTKREKALVATATKLEHVKNQGPRGYSRSYIAL